MEIYVYTAATLFVNLIQPINHLIDVINAAVDKSEFTAIENSFITS